MRMRQIHRRRRFLLWKRPVFRRTPARYLAILGPNASGKSTLLKMIAGALEPLSGRVLLNGFVTHDWRRAFAAQRIAMVQQESPLLFPSRAWEFVMQGRHPVWKIACDLKPTRMLTDRARMRLAQVGAEHLAIAGWTKFPAEKSSESFWRARWPNSRCCCCSMSQPCIWTSRAQVDLLAWRCGAWHVKIAIRVVVVTHELNLVGGICGPGGAVAARQMFARRAAGQRCISGNCWNRFFRRRSAWRWGRLAVRA